MQRLERANLERFTKLNLLPTPHPIPLDARSRLEQLKAAGIPPDYRTAEHVLDELIQNQDIEGLYVLCERGKSFNLLEKQSSTYLVMNLTKPETPIPK